MNTPHFLPGDKVYYNGERFKDRLNGKMGWIHAPVVNNPEAFVVEFPDTRNPKDPNDTDDYIMPVRVLTVKRPPAAEKEKEKKQEGPEVQPRRRRRDAEEE